MNPNVRKLKKRLLSFEVTFHKHAEICFSCHSLNIWAIGDAMPERCHRCANKLTIKTED